MKRWDFENEDDYSSYQSSREAMPKCAHSEVIVISVYLGSSCRAAFQYGVKMNDGRKTRRQQGRANKEKAKLDRKWQQISQVRGFAPVIFCTVSMLFVDPSKA